MGRTVDDRTTHEAELSSASIPKHAEIALRRDPIVFFSRMLDAILKLARSQRKFGGDLVGTYVEGKNIVVQYRFGEHSEERLPALATDLARLNVSVIVAFGAGVARTVHRVAPDLCSLAATRSGW
jgi:hypothetical protein